MTAKEFFEIASEKAKQKVLEHYYDFEVHDDWYQFTIDDFKQSNKHFEVTKVYFSGFWSQGDGAMFEYDSITQLLKDEFIESLKLSPMRKNWLKHWSYIGASGRQRGHYYHEKSCNHSIDFSGNCSYGYLYDWIYSFGSDFEEYVEDLYCEQAHELYKTLEKEYDYLTSAKIIQEGLIDCEVEIEYDVEEDEVYITTRRRL